MKCHKVDYKVIGDDIQIVEVELGMNLIIELVAGAACTGSQRITALNHKVGDTAVENRSVVQRV